MSRAFASTRRCITIFQKGSKEGLNMNNESGKMVKNIICFDCALKTMSKDSRILTLDENRPLVDMLKERERIKKSFIAGS